MCQPLCQKKLDFAITGEGLDNPIDTSLTEHVSMRFKIWDSRYVLLSNMQITVQIQPTPPLESPLPPSRHNYVGRQFVDLRD